MTDWLVPIFGEDLAPIANLVVVFLVLVVLLVAGLWIWRRLTGGGFAVGVRARRARLGVLDSAALDSRHRLILIRRDHVGHLILTGGPTDLVVERNIELPELMIERTAEVAEDRAVISETEHFRRQPGGTNRAGHRAPATAGLGARDGTSGRCSRGGGCDSCCGSTIAPGA